MIRLTWNALQPHRISVFGDCIPLNYPIADFQAVTATEIVEVYKFAHRKTEQNCSLLQNPVGVILPHQSNEPGPQKLRVLLEIFPASVRFSAQDPLRVVVFDYGGVQFEVRVLSCEVGEASDQ